MNGTNIYMITRPSGQVPQRKAAPELLAKARTATPGLCCDRCKARKATPERAAKARTATPRPVAKGRPAKRQFTEQQRQDIKRGTAAAKLEIESARTTDPELSRRYALRAAEIRRGIEEGR